MVAKQSLPGLVDELIQKNTYKVGPGKPVRSVSYGAPI